MSVTRADLVPLAVASALFVLAAAAGARVSSSSPPPRAVPQAEPPVRAAASRPTPCPRRPGLAKPTTATVDPDLDPDLVGVATPWPLDVDPRWTEGALRGALDRPGVQLHCEEWPCLLELHAPDHPPRAPGHTLHGDLVD